MNGIFKYGLTALAFAGLLSASTTMAEAKGFSAGHYRFQEGTSLLTACVRANGTAFLTNVGGFNGRWTNRTLNGTVTGFLWVNDSFENISVIALGVANSKMTDWFDANPANFSVLNALRITKISNACPALAPPPRRNGKLLTR